MISGWVVSRASAPSRPAWRKLCGSDYYRRLRQRYRRQPLFGEIRWLPRGNSDLLKPSEALVANGLRHKIRLQVDGGLKTGVDIIKSGDSRCCGKFRHEAADGGAGL